MNNSLITELSTCLTKDFGLPSEELSKTKEFDDIKIKVNKVIQYLLNNDFQKLINIFYRLDIDENKVRNILSNEPSDFIVEKLSEIILEREIQKAKTRLRYKNAQE